MDKELITVTISGETYNKYKNAYDQLQKGLIPIKFGRESLFNYEWHFYTKDQALKRMAEEYEFMNYKHTEQLMNQNRLLREEIKILEKQLNEKKA